jgi:hypothetical protein
VTVADDLRAAVASDFIRHASRRMVPGKARGARLGVVIGDAIESRIVNDSAAVSRVTPKSLFSFIDFYD